LGFDSDSSFSFDIQFVEDLLISAWLDGASKFEEAVTESAFAMVNMSNNAKIPIAVNGDGCQSLFEIRDRLARGCESQGSGGERSPLVVITRMGV